MTTCQKSEAIFPVVVVEVNGIKCRALIDSGAGSSYVSTKLIELLKLKPSQTLVKNIDMLMASKTSKLEIYDMKLDFLNGSFSLPVKATKVNKSDFLSIDNPNYPELITQHPHLKGVMMSDNDVKDSLPVHVILGSGEYAKIKPKPSRGLGVRKPPLPNSPSLDGSEWVLGTNSTAMSCCLPRPPKLNTKNYVDLMFSGSKTHHNTISQWFLASSKNN